MGVKRPHGQIKSEGASQEEDASNKEGDSDSVNDEPYNRKPTFI